MRVIVSNPFDGPAKAPGNWLHATLTLAGFVLFTASLFFMESRREQLVEANQIKADAQYQLASVALERHKVTAFSTKVSRELDKFNRAVEQTTTNYNTRLSSTTNTIDGTFTTMTFMDTNGFSRQVAYVDGRPFLDFPYKVPLMKFSDAEWNWMTNQLRGLLVTGTNAQQNSSVFTEHH